MNELGCPESVIRECMGLAYWLADRYYAHGLDRDDLRQEALIGLCKAHQDFNGWGTFTGFARLCIERQLITAVKLAGRRKHEILNYAFSLDKPVNDRSDGGQRGELPILAEFIEGGTDPAEIVERRQEFDNVVALVRDRCSPTERAGLAMVLNGEPYAQRPDSKRIDNSIQRARRKLKAAEAPAA